MGRAIGELADLGDADACLAQSDGGAMGGVDREAHLDQPGDDGHRLGLVAVGDGAERGPFPRQAIKGAQEGLEHRRG